MIYCEIEINLKRFKGSLDSDVIINVSNIERSTLFSTYKICYPILTEIPDLTENHDEFMPINSTARITLDNSEGSLGYERKFSDLLDNYTISEQEIVISFKNVNDEVSGTDTPDTTWLMVGDSVDIDLERNLVSINIKNLSLQDREVTKEVNSVAFPNANTRSFGKYIPYCVGENTEVPLINIDNKKYSINTETTGTSTYSSANTFYNRHPDGTYRQTELTDNIIYTTMGVTGLLEEPAIATAIIPFSVSPKRSFLLNQLEFQLTGNNKVYSPGQFECEIVQLTKLKKRQELTRFRWDVLGSAAVSKSPYASHINSTNNFTVVFNFAEPVHVDMVGEDLTNGNFEDSIVTRQYFVINDTESNPDTPFIDRDVKVKFYTDGGTAPNYGSHGVLTDTRDLFTAEVTANVTRHRVFGVYITSKAETSVDTNGLRVGYYNLAASNASCNLNNLNLVGDLNFTDTKPNQILPRLFSASEYNTTDVFSTWSNYSGTYTRSLAGSTVGKVTRLQLARELMKNSASRLVMLSSTNSKKIGLFAWGSELTRVARIDDRKLKSFKITYGNRSTVINNVTLSYNRTTLNKTSALLLTQGANAGYDSVIAEKSISGSDSKAIYGTNNLSDSAFQYINDLTSANSVADFYLKSFNDVYAQIEFTYPFLDNEDIDEILSSQVIELITAKLPVVYGTNSNPLPIYFEGEDGIETNGVDLIRARKYRVQVKSKKIQKIDGVFFVYFIGKMLNNEYDPS